MNQNLASLKDNLINELKDREERNILSPENVILLTKLIRQAETIEEANNIALLGMTYKKTGFHFQKQLERTDNNIRYFKKNESLSYKTSTPPPIAYTSINNRR